MYTREESINLIKDYVMDFEAITTAWEGGSVATGFADDYSDLDLCLVCKPGDQEIIVEKMVTFLEATFGKKHMYRLPEPAWHGFSQVFFDPVKTPELFYVDFVVIGEDIEDKLTEANRHGIAAIWKENYKIDTQPRSQEKIRAVANSLYHRTVQIDFLLILELKKALKRRIFSEAFPAYMSFISRCLVPLMNIKYRPEKADFGMRYIYRDYPQASYKLIEDALRVDTIDKMHHQVEGLFETYQALKDDLK